MNKIDTIDLKNNIKLINKAKNYDNYEEFEIELGWEDWMMELVDLKYNDETGEYEEYAEDEELPEFEIEKINDFIKKIWQIAQIQKIKNEDIKEKLLNDVQNNFENIIFWKLKEEADEHDYEIIDNL